MMKLSLNINYVLIATFTASFSVQALAGGPDCGEPTLGCAFTRMPLLNQDDEAIDPEHDDWLPNGGERSMLCAPTSGVMSVDAVINHGDPELVVAGWAAREYLPEDWTGRVRALSRKFLTSPKEGTLHIPAALAFGEIARGLSVRGHDAGKSMGEIAWPRASTSDFMKYIRDGYAQSIAYGHYVKKVKRILGQKIITFSRKGGHVVALQGYLVRDHRPLLAINNPGGAVRDWRTPEPLSSGIRFHGFLKSTITIVPHIFGTGYTMYRVPETDGYKFIDGYYGIGTR